jgi:hypothetical protein
MFGPNDRILFGAGGGRTMKRDARVASPLRSFLLRVVGPWTGGTTNWSRRVAVWTSMRCCFRWAFSTAVQSEEGIDRLKRLLRVASSLSRCDRRRANSIHPCPGPLRSTLLPHSRRVGGVRGPAAYLSGFLNEISIWILLNAISIWILVLEGHLHHIMERRELSTHSDINYWRSQGSSSTSGDHHSPIS